ncbi:MAG: hypothetical protein AB1649_23435 [Chloroflexota bacterium]
MQNQQSPKRTYLPILILLAANIICGLIVFRNYGLSWDEPLFYDYAESLGYAYSPREWFSGNFNLENAYGSSGTDHANRGPAYILLARGPVRLLTHLGLDAPSAWHLVNFLTFQLGVLLLYRLAIRWIRLWPAIAATALFAWQPLLWGHSFINPKDPPFLVFFLGAVLFGFEMVDTLRSESKSRSQKIWAVLLAAFFLGIATSIRVLGPLAGVLVAIYALRALNKKALPFFIAYAFAAIAIMFIAWPYLWLNPLQRFVEVFGFMSDNPTQLRVLFSGEYYRADELPRRYLPTLLAFTLTEPVWPLFLVGLVRGFWKPIAGLMNSPRDDRRQTTERFPLSTDHWSLRSPRSGITDYFLLLAWFLIPIAYVLILRPSMYDGFRHFLFMLPPVFIFAGFAFEKLFELVRSRFVSVILTVLILLTGLIPSVALHPYEYAYYNSFVGGTQGAFRTYETEYWLTCYKEAMEDFQRQATEPSTIYVHREAYIAATYVRGDITVLDERGAADQINSGDYVLVNSRSNEDLKTFEDATIVLHVSRGNAVFCVIRRIP